METDKVLRENIDNSKLLVKLSIIGGIGSAVMAILVLILSGISSWAGSDVFAMSILPLTLAVVFATGSMIYGLLSASSAQEDEDKRLLEKRKENIINVNEDVRFTAGRSFENYKKYTPYFLAAFAAVVTFTLLGLFWYYRSVRTVVPIPENALKSAFVAVIFMCICIFSGAFFVGQSRDKDFRWLRPLGAWLILAFVISLFATFSALMFRFGYPHRRQSNHIAFGQSRRGFGPFFIHPDFPRTNTAVDVALGHAFCPAQEVVIQPLASLFGANRLQNHHC